jgi:hypothetical protein
MGKVDDFIGPQLTAWLQAQHVFFVATAPLSADGHVNCSPKGLDTFRILGRDAVAYADLTGSGVETIAHLRENGRIVLMFCAFEGSPKIVRLHGRGQVLLPGAEEFETLRPLFPRFPGLRSIVRVAIDRVSDSCGYGVPRYALGGQRDTLTRWAESKGDDGLAVYREQKNARSLDGLPGIPGALV